MDSDIKHQAQHLPSLSRIPDHLSSCPLCRVIFAIYQYAPDKYPLNEFIPCLARGSGCHRGTP
jgi:hypothetical protein